MEIVLVLVTVPNADVGRSIARALIDERLVACVNRIPGVVSTFRWEATVQEESEELLVLKTTRSSLDALEARVSALHPYQVPEFVVMAADRVSAAYAGWVRAETTR